jgi:exopolysaccharide biosynthesis protein
VAPGVWQQTVMMAVEGPLAPFRAHVVRIDPTRVHFALDSATRDYGTKGAWTSEQLPPDAVLAVNAGQFIGGVSWGWVVHNAIETSAPGSGTLAMAFVVDGAGSPALLTPGELAAARGRVRLAFQSYPMLLAQGSMPWELQGPGRGVDLDHRDSRLAICTSADGSVMIALTRFTSLGAAGETIPFGPTVVEMAEFMRTLGCVRAMMLDGGISSQMSVRYANGSVRHWSNWRKVPLGLLVRSRLQGP